MWQGAFIAPWTGAPQQEDDDFGAAKPPENANTILLASAPDRRALADCTIKGNVNRSGECIYHQPNSRCMRRSR